MNDKEMNNKENKIPIFKDMDTVTKSNSLVSIEGHIKIFNPKTNEVYINQRDN